MTSAALLDRPAPPLLGAQTPTWMVAPDCVSNAAGEFGEFMVQVGRPLDPWQALTLETWCGETSAGTWVAFECFEFVQRQNGKGEPLIARELGGLFVAGEQLIIHTAHKSEAVQQAWKRTLQIVEGSDDLRRRLSPVRGISEKDGEEGLRLRSGAELQFRVRSGRGKLRSLGCECLVCDEALFLTAEALESAGPTMMAMPNAQIVYASTPPLKPKPDDPVPHIMTVRERARAGEPRMGGVCWENPPGTDVDDPRAHAAANPAYGRRITPERMRDMRRLLSEEGFARECIGIWPEPPDPRGARVVDEDAWNDLVDVGGRPPAVAFALVASRDRLVAYLAYAGAVDGELVKVGLVERLTDLSRAPARLMELKDRWDPIGFAVSSRSENLLLDLQRAGLHAPEDPERPRRGDLRVPTAADDAAAFGLLLDSVRARTIRHADDVPVNSALEAAKTRPVGAGRTWDDKAGDMAPIRAVCHAAWLWKAWSHLVVRDLDPVGVW